MKARCWEISKELDEALLVFSRKHDLLVPGEKPHRERYEEWTRGEEFIDSLPSSCVFYADGLKKVYDDGVEFISSSAGEAPGVHSANYIANRMIERVAPEIVRCLDELRFSINPLQVVMERVRVFPDDLLRPDVQVLFSGLSLAEKLAFSEWSFERFGSGV